MDYSSWGCKELDTTEQLTLSLSQDEHIIDRVNTSSMG